MATTRTRKSFLFVGLLSLLLLSSTLTLFAEGPAEAPRPGLEPNPIDDWFTEPEDGSATCNRAPWGERTLDDLLCLELYELLPTFW